MGGATQRPPQTLPPNPPPETGVAGFLLETRIHGVRVAGEAHEANDSPCHVLR